MISLSFIHRNNKTIRKNTPANAKWNFSLVLFLSFSDASDFFNPSISIQKQEVSDVMAPSTLGNNAEMRAMINIMLTAWPNVLLNAIVGKRSSGAVLIPFADAYK